MRPTSLASWFCCRRFGLTAVLAAWLGSGCATPAASVGRPVPAPVVQSPPIPPPPPPVAQSAPPLQMHSLLPDIIIHQADLHGQFENKQGGTITIRALLMMTKTQPAVGNKGVLFYGPPGAHADADWIALGDVEVKRELDPEGRFQVKCVDDDKKFVIPSGGKSTPLVKKSRLMLRWQY